MFSPNAMEPANIAERRQVQILSCKCCMESIAFASTSNNSLEPEFQKTIQEATEGNSGDPGSNSGGNLGGNSAGNSGGFVPK